MVAAASSRPWNPDHYDHLIYHWVKMEGKTQSWVAEQLNINQATVSRVIQRYERWQAHATDRESGRLDHAERLRAQRWLTFERNEQILASCLRIANEMEGFTDVSKSTISHSASRPSQETEVRTQHSTIDRTGMVARYLRLAFRINMEQLKLAELDPPPLALPLTADELAQQDLDDAALTQELLALSSRHIPSTAPPRPDPSLAETPTIHPISREQTCSRNRPAESFDDGHPQQEEPIEHSPTHPLPPTLNLEPGTLNPVPSPSTLAPPTLNLEPATSNSAPAVHSLHNLHTADAPQIAASGNGLCTCASPPCAEKNSHAPCIADPQQLPWAANSSPPTANQSIHTAPPMPGWPS